MAVCHPFHRRLRSHSDAIVTIIALWFVSGLLLGPWLLFYRIQSPSSPSDSLVVNSSSLLPLPWNYDQCIQEWPDGSQGFTYFVTVVFTTFYLVPLILIANFYRSIALTLWQRTRQSRRNAIHGRSYGGLTRVKSIRVVKMMLVVVAIFACSWLPLYALFIALHLNPQVIEANPLIELVILPLCQFMGMANSGFNPWIYCLYSRNYREGVRAILQCKSLHRLRLRLPENMPLATGSQGNSAWRQDGVVVMSMKLTNNNNNNRQQTSHGIS